MAWQDWARTVPGGSWTVQLAAVRLDRAEASGSLSDLSSQDDLFLLPSGALPGGLAPVCYGVYPTEAAARRAAASLRASGASSLGSPIPKPLSALTGS